MKVRISLRTYSIFHLFESRIYFYRLIIFMRLLDRHVALALKDSDCFVSTCCLIVRMIKIRDNFLTLLLSEFLKDPDYNAAFPISCKTLSRRLHLNMIKDMRHPKNGGLKFIRN